MDGRPLSTATQLYYALNHCRLRNGLNPDSGPPAFSASAQVFAHPLDVRALNWQVQAREPTEEAGDSFMGRADSFIAVVRCTMRI